jgi:hypothetical protein
MRTALRPPQGPAPSKARTSDGHTHASTVAKSGRKVRIADETDQKWPVAAKIEPFAGNEFDDEPSPVTPSAHSASREVGGGGGGSSTKDKPSSPKKRKAPQEAVKYGNHLRPVLAMYETEQGTEGDGHGAKLNQFDLMRREQQQLKRSIGAALQNFARANKKQESLHLKTKSKIEKAASASKHLYLGFTNFEMAREEGVNEATHLWEEKVQLRAGFLEAKMRFLSAADAPETVLASSSQPSTARVSSPPPASALRTHRPATTDTTTSSKPGNSGTNSTNNSNNNNNTAPGVSNEVSAQLLRMMQQSRQLNKKLMEDFGKPGGQIHKDMARMRRAAQRDMDYQELRALLSSSNRWFLTCLGKMREHLRRSSNTAPPSALKFIFVLQLLLKLQTATNERQQRQQRLLQSQQQQFTVPPESGDFQTIVPNALSVSHATRKAGMLADSGEDVQDVIRHPPLSISPRHSPNGSQRQSPGASPKHSPKHSPRQSPTPTPNLSRCPSPNQSHRKVPIPSTQRYQGPRSRNTTPQPSLCPSASQRHDSITSNSESNFPRSLEMTPTSPDGQTGPLTSLRVTPRVLSVLLLSPIFTKEELRKALVQQLVEVVRDGIGWEPESFARFLERHELPVPAELLNMLRTIAKERATKRDRERRESSLAVPTRSKQSVLVHSFGTRPSHPTESLAPYSEIADDDNDNFAVVEPSEPKAAFPELETEMNAAQEPPRSMDNIEDALEPANEMRLDIQIDSKTLKREALLAISDEV